MQNQSSIISINMLEEPSGGALATPYITHWGQVQSSRSPIVAKSGSSAIDRLINVAIDATYGGQQLITATKADTKTETNEETWIRVACLFIVASLSGPELRRALFAVYSIYRHDDSDTPGKVLSGEVDKAIHELDIFANAADKKFAEAALNSVRAVNASKVRVYPAPNGGVVVEHRRNNEILNLIIEQDLGLVIRVDDNFAIRNEFRLSDETINDLIIRYSAEVKLLNRDRFGGYNGALETA